jgi:serine/threonine-protein kinase HipA
MSRQGRVFYNDSAAGLLEQREDGQYVFTYLPEYLAKTGSRALSLTLPLSPEAYESAILFPFFSGLLAEGSLKDLQCRLYRIDPDDDFTRLLKTTRHDVIGAVTVEEVVP